MCFLLLRLPLSLLLSLFLPCSLARPRSPSLALLLLAPQSALFIGLCPSGIHSLPPGVAPLKAYLSLPGNSALHCHPTLPSCLVSAQFFFVVALLTRRSMTSRLILSLRQIRIAPSSTIDHPLDHSSHPSPQNTTPATIPTSKPRHASDLRMFEPIPPSNLLKIYKGCSNCRIQRIKCNGLEPCSRCHAFGLQCQYIVLPNQTAHRLANLGAVPTASSASVISSPHPSIPTSISTPSTLSSGSPLSSETSPQARASKNRDQTSYSPRRNSDEDRETSPEESTLTSSPVPGTFSSATISYTQSLSGQPNVLLYSFVEAVDPTIHSYDGPPGQNDPHPSPDVMRRLVECYMRYLHPIQRIVDDQDPEFWTRLDHPLEPKVASVVYAMCTIGALFIGEAPSSGILDDLVYDFYRRTLAIKEERPEDVATIQTSLILQDFFVVSHRIEEGTAFHIDMMEIAERIQLAETVQKFATQDKLSPADVTVRNTWRLLVFTEIMANMISLMSGRVHPLKDLTDRGLEFRLEEVPALKAPAADAMYYHYCSLFKIFQGITRIKLPMSLRDMHPVTSILDAFSEWYTNLPKSLKCSTVKNYTTGSAGSKAHAKTLDLFYRLGHIYLLNNLPPSVRSSPTGLGPQRESPLRILATCANGITGIMGDLTKDPESRNYLLIHGIRCLTEAATIQMANSKELDPAISTPAKVNFMKTLWCIKQFNVAVPIDTLNLILASFDTVGKQTAPTKWQGKQPADMGPKVDVSRPRTPPMSSALAEPSMLSGPSRSGREVSMTSDYSSSTASTREGSHMIIFETEENDREPERSRRLPASAPQDGAAAYILSLSLESPTGGHSRARVEPNMTSAFPRDGKYEGGGLGLQVPESLSRMAQQISQRDVYDSDRSGSSSVVFSPNIESPTPGAYRSLEAHPQRRSPLSPRIGHRRPTAHPQHGQEYEPARDTRYNRYSPGSGQANIVASARGRAPTEHSWDSQRHGLGERYVDEIKHGMALRESRATQREEHGDPRIVDHTRSPVEDGQSNLGPSSTRHISPSSTSSADYGASFGPSSAQSRQPWDDPDASRSLLLGGEHQKSSYYPSQELHPLRQSQDFYPAFGAYQKRPPQGVSGHEPAAQDYLGPPRQLQSRNRAPRAGPQLPHLTTTFPRRPYHPQEYSPRTPLSATSDTDAYNGYGATQIHSARVSTATTLRAYSPARQRPDREAFGPNAVSPGSESHEAGHHSRYLPTRSGAVSGAGSPTHSSRSGGPIYPEMDPLRANLMSPSSSPPPPAGFSNPASPQSPKLTRLTAMTSTDSRRLLSAPDPRGVEGIGSRGPGLIPGYSSSVLNKTASSKGGFDESGLPRVAGRKRPSVSMYSLNGREDDSRSSSYEGKGGVVSGGGMAITKSDEMRKPLPGGYNADPLHQDGADALRSWELKWEDVARQTRREQRQHVETEQPQQHHNSQYLTQTRHSLPEHPYPANHPSYKSRLSPPSSSSSSQHSRPPRPQLSQLQTYSWHSQNHSYSLSSPQHHQDHPHQNHHQHEPRTSPLSSLSPSRSRDTSGGSTTEKQHTLSMPPNLQDQYQPQQHEHHDHLVFVHQRGRERCLMPPPLLAGHTGDNVTDEEEDSVARMSDLQRNPIRRKYR